MKRKFTNYTTDQIFHYNRLISKICDLITHHKNRELVSWDKSFSDSGYKYPNRHDFYYKCRTCGYLFFNNTISKEDLNYIKQYDKEHPDD